MADDQVLLKILERLTDNVEKLAAVAAKQGEAIAALAESGREDRLHGRRLADSVDSLTGGMERLQVQFALATKERIAESKKRIQEVREALAERGRA